MGQVVVRPEVLYAWRGPALLVTDGRGECGEAAHALSGFYVREARVLRTLRLELNGERPWLCERGAADTDVLELCFVYPELTEFGGGGTGQSGDEVTTDARGIPHRALDLRLRYAVRLTSLDVSLVVANRSRATVALDLAWAVGADFADIIEAHAGKREHESPVDATADGPTVRFAYRDPALPYHSQVTASGTDGGGADAAWHSRAGRVATHLRLEPRQQAELALRVEARDYEAPLAPEDVSARDRRWRAWRDGLTRVTTPGNALAERAVADNVRDVASFALLDGAPDEWLAPQAGMPLYPALFGRDALTAGWQAALLDRGEALDASLTRLGRLQSDRDDDWRDAEPGRIPQQVRRGPLARIRHNPFAASYADFASPLMFVVALGHLYAWAGERAGLRRHWDAARRILDWARERGDRDGDGYLEYLTRSPAGAKNQGWKDSGDAIVYEDGTPVPAPLGTCELQGYWFAAQQIMAVLSWQMGARDDARAHWRSAAELKARFNRDWWLEDDGFVAIAMDADKRPVRAPSSNVGHCIAAGIVSDEHLPRVVGRLFAPDLFGGWGVRTLSTEHASYNPLSYHLGSVWAVEQATIAFGLRRFGFDARALDLARALFDLAELYPGHRIPETVGGYARAERPFPGAYPRANTPQLWNAGAFPLLVHTILGLQPVAPLDLLVVDPVLPSWLPEVVLHDLRIAGATATIRFWRDGTTSHAEVLHKRGTLHLVKQPPLESLTAGVRDRFGALADSLLHH